MLNWHITDAVRVASIFNTKPPVLGIYRIRTCNSFKNADDNLQNYLNGVTADNQAIDTLK
jgi:hypothetical protein